MCYHHIRQARVSARFRSFVPEGGTALRIFSRGTRIALKESGFYPPLQDCGAYLTQASAFTGAFAGQDGFRKDDF